MLSVSPTVSLCFVTKIIDKNLKKNGLFCLIKRWQNKLFFPIILLSITYKLYWERYINVLAEVDCLLAMTVYAKSTRTCRPNFVDKGYEVTQAVHPALGNSDFVANDISFEHPIIILTGPNMGG